MKILSSREVYRCRLFWVTEDEASDTRRKFEIKRSVIRHNGSAVMMAVDEKKRILLVRQYRLPAGKIHVGTARRKTGRRRVADTGR